MHLLGLDIGGTKSVAVIGAVEGEIIERRAWASNAERGPEAMLADIRERSRELLKIFPGVKAVGVSIGGPLDADRGIIQSPPHLPGWDALPLKERLEEQLRLPVAVEHDAAACALAEFRWGTDGEVRHLVYLTCGTGCGAGLVLDGRIHRGAGGYPCDLGHWRIRQHGPVAYGKEGTVEAYCSGTGLPLLAAWKFPGRWTMNPPSGPEISVLAAKGDADALEIIRLNAEALGDVCALLADLLCPHIIVLGSLASYFGSDWLNLVHQRYLREVQPEVARLCTVRPSKLGDRIQDLGALVVAVEAASRPTHQ